MLRMLADPNRMLATILIANNAVNVAIVLVSTYVTDTIVDFTDAPGWGFFIKTVIITLLLLFFGEIFQFLTSLAENQRIFNKLFKIMPRIAYFLVECSVRFRII